MATVKIFNNYLRLPFLFLALVEISVFFLSVYSAALVRFQESDTNYTNIMINFDGGDIGLVATIFTTVMMLSMVALGHYKSQQHYAPGAFAETVVRVMVSLLLGSFSLIIIFYILPITKMGRGFHFISFLLAFFGVITVRALFYHFIGTNFLKRNILVVGAGERAKTLISEKGGSQDGVSYRVAGYVALNGEPVSIPDEKLLQISCDDICSYALENEIDEIILAIDDRRKTYPEEELIKCKLAGMKIVDPVTFLEREQGKVNLEMLHSGWMIYAPGFNRNDMKSLLARLFDIVSSLLILAIMFPMIAIAAFLISAESGFKHPVFYRQIRVGLDGKEFSLLKFRSMKVDAEKDGKAVWAQKNDNRITMVGRFIRKTRIDELPQIINILKGDMRLVGPRPERPEFVEELSKKIPYYKKRHTVKPGLAGWAQLNYPYGATERDAYEKLQYDLYYVKNHNVILDFFILLQTIEIVIMGKGAR